jgi:hypothetical protein
MKCLITIICLIISRKLRCLRLLSMSRQAYYSHNPVPTSPKARPKTSSFRLPRASTSPAPEPEEPVALALVLVLVADPVGELLDSEVVVAVAVFAEPDEVVVGPAVLVRAILVSSSVPFRTRSQLAAIGCPRPESSAKFSMSNGNRLDRSGTSEKNAAYAAGTVKSSG